MNSTPGEGSTFKLFLPVNYSESSPAKPKVATSIPKVASPGTEDSIADVDVPLLLMHGTADDVVVGELRLDRDDFPYMLVPLASRARVPLQRTFFGKRHDRMQHRIVPFQAPNG